MRTSLPTDSAERKEYPIAEGCLDYFPAALAGVARHSKLGNDKHNPGEPLHWARGKSADHANCIARHLMDLAAFRAHAERGPGVSQEHVRALLDEANALVWRAAALSQELHEQFDNAPMPPRAWVDQKPATAAEKVDALIKEKIAKDGPLTAEQEKYARHAATSFFNRVEGSEAVPSHTAMLIEKGGAMPDGMAASHYCVDLGGSVRPGYAGECKACRKAIAGTG